MNYLHTFSLSPFDVLFSHICGIFRLICFFHLGFVQFINVRGFIQSPFCLHFLPPALFGRLPGRLPVLSSSRFLPDGASWPLLLAWFWGVARKFSRGGGGERQGKVVKREGREVRWWKATTTIWMFFCVWPILLCESSAEAGTNALYFDNFTFLYWKY